MTDIKDFLKELISLPGLSGYEAPAREVISREWQTLVDELSVSPLGSLHALKRGSSPEPRPRILLAAHMDAIGMMVTRITPEGFLGFTEVGGLDPRILPAQPVRVYGKEPLRGVIVQPSDRLLPPSQKGKPVEMKHLLIDTGLPAEEVRRLVKVGDPIAFDTEPLELPEDLICGHTLDNRASVAALTVCLQTLQRAVHDWDVYAVATAQEEETLGGGFTSPFEIRPTLAIAIDVTFAKGPGVNDYRGKTLGGGVVLGWGPQSHPRVFDDLKALAERLDIPFEIEVYPRASGTDAYAMQIVAEGIPTMVVSIPLRYMHTPVEVVSLSDIRRVGRLLAEYILRLTPDDVKKIQWEEA